jgi:hypothetical protein
VLIDQPLELQGGINVAPTDGNGVTLARTPQQVCGSAACAASWLAGCLRSLCEQCLPFHRSAGARLGNKSVTPP